MSGAVYYSILPPNRGPKKPFLDDHVWALRASKLRHRRALRQERALLRREALARIFCAWKGADVTASFNFGCTLRAGMIKQFVSFTLCCRKLKAALSIAKHQALEHTLDTITETTPAYHTQKLLRPFLLLHFSQ